MSEIVPEASKREPLRRRKRHPGTIERRGKRLRVILYAGGKRHTFTLDTTDEREAKEFAEAKAAELTKEVKRQRIGLPGAVKVSWLFDRFETDVVPGFPSLSSQESYKRHIKLFRRFFVEGLADPKVGEIGSGHVQQFMTWRKTCGATVMRPGSMNLTRSMLHHVFAWGESLELREGNPVNKIKPEQADPRPPIILDDEQYQRLLAVCRGNPMLYMFVTAMGETGARCESEVLWWRWDDLDFEGGFVKIAMRDGHRTKGGKERWVPMTSVLRSALRPHVARFRFLTYNDEPTPWVFHHPTANRGAKPGERIGGLRRAFQSAARRAGLPAGLHQHDLRHRRITTWLGQGKNPVHVKEAVGHADLRTTMAYTHLSREHLRSLVTDERTPRRPALVEQQQA